MKKKTLGVNIDHVATIRNARGEIYPDPLIAAQICESSGADSITIHLREDRRHIRDYDLKNIKKKLKIPLNLEIAPTKEMLNIAIKYKPNYVCIVPEKRKEITTEGGLNLKNNMKFLKSMIPKLQRHKIRVSLFIEPSLQDIKLAYSMKVNCVELHTGAFCGAFNKRRKKLINSYFKKLKESSSYAKKLNLEVHAGHGLTYKSTQKILKIKDISEFNIGHFIVSESLIHGIAFVVKRFKKIISK